MKRVAFYGGSFDPVHNAHLTIAERLIDLFDLQKLIFVPAFHAPHKKNLKPTSAYDRYAMLALATSDKEKIEISKTELENPKEPYTIQTLRRLLKEFSDYQIFFIIGADSWQEINTWKNWEEVLTIVNIIVVTRPGYPIVFDHVSEEICKRIIDVRGKTQISVSEALKIYITDIVQSNASATQIRRIIKEGKTDWKNLVPENVARYIVKYGLYLK